MSLVGPTDNDVEAARLDEEDELAYSVDGMPLDEFIDYTMMPNQARAETMEWTFERIPEIFESKDDEVLILSHLASLYAAAQDADEDAVDADGMPKHFNWKKIAVLIVKKGIKKVIKWLLKKLLKVAFKVIRKLVTSLIKNIVKTIIRFVVRPVLMGALEFIGVNPELWPFVAIAGGIAAVGYFLYDKLTSKDAPNTVPAAPAAEPTPDVATQAEEVLQPKHKHPSDVSPRTGAAYPSPAGAPAVPVANDGSLRALISRGEGDYNSYNTGTKGVAGGKVGYSGHADLSNITIREILDSNDLYDGNDKRRMFAVGRYQFIASTLKNLVKKAGVSLDTKFTPAVQDSLFDAFIRGTPLGNYIAGISNDLHGALKYAASQWASIADPDTGTSVYAGPANHASISSSELALVLQRERANHGVGTQVQATNVNVTPSVQTPVPQTQTNQASGSPGGTSIVSPSTSGNRTIIKAKNKNALIAVNM
jgi:hypothetical protein